MTTRPVCWCGEPAVGVVIVQAEDGMWDGDFRCPAHAPAVLAGDE